MNLAEMNGYSRWKRSFRKNSSKKQPCNMCAMHHTRCPVEYTEWKVVNFSFDAILKQIIVYCF